MSPTSAHLNFPVCANEGTEKRITLMKQINKQGKSEYKAKVARELKTAIKQVESGQYAMKYVRKLDLLAEI